MTSKGQRNADLYFLWNKFCNIFLTEKAFQLNNASIYR